MSYSDLIFRDSLQLTLTGHWNQTETRLLYFHK